MGSEIIAATPAELAAFAISITKPVGRAHDRVAAALRFQRKGMH